MNRDTELLKIQVYVGYCHSDYRSRYSGIFGAIIAVYVSLMGLFLQKAIDLLTYYLSIIVGVPILFLILWSVYRDYRNNLRKVDNMIKRVNEGNSLPSVEDMTKTKKQSRLEERRQDGDETMKEKSKKKQIGVLEELIQRVDDPACGWKPLSRWQKLRRNTLNVIWLSVSLFYLGVLSFAIWLLLPITETKILLPTLIALTALILQSGIIIREFTKPEEREEIRNATIEWNYQRIKDDVDDEQHLLLKALIRMKTLQPNFSLSKVYKKNPYLFSEKNLIGMLYD